VENCCLFCKPQICSGLNVTEITTGDINAAEFTLMGLNNGLKTLKWRSTGLEYVNWILNRAKT
jgi:hypothetical protein